MKREGDILGMLLVVALAMAGCKRERRVFTVPPSEAQTARMVRIGDLVAGGPGATNAPWPAGYEETAYAISQGQQLYEYYNCIGCHAHGGGGMGVALIDAKWIFGSEPQQIFSTIVEGRPKGMPAFGQRLTDHQVWQLVAYVRSLSGLTPRQSSSGRDDHMSAQPPPNSITPAKPKNTSSPE